MALISAIIRENLSKIISWTTARRPPADHSNEPMTMACARIKARTRTLRARTPTYRMNNPMPISPASISPLSRSHGTPASWRGPVRAVRAAVPTQTAKIVMMTTKRRGNSCSTKRRISPARKGTSTSNRTISIRLLVSYCHKKTCLTAHALPKATPFLRPALRHPIHTFMVFPFFHKRSIRPARSNRPDDSAGSAWPVV